jgi:hypothetical protein
MIEWIKANDVLLAWVALGSAVMFVAAILVTPLALVRLPADRFAKPKRERRPPRGRSAALRIAWQVGRNALGAVLIVAGILMLLLPGQGVLTILVGLMLMSFPGKYRLVRWFIRRRPVLAVINRIRARWGHPPFWFEPPCSDARREGPSGPHGREK